MKGKKMTIVALLPLILIVFLLGIGVFKFSGSKGEIDMITPQDAQVLIGTEGVILLDVRTTREYNQGHIDGAVLLPLDQLGVKAEEALKDKESTIIVYCRSGNRSRTAQSLLIKKGYSDVRDLGGIISWPYDVVK